MSIPFDVKAWAPYKARNNNELSLVVGEVYTVIETEQRGAWFGAKSQSGHTVWFPASYTKHINGTPIQAPTQPKIEKTNNETVKQIEVKVNPTEENSNNKTLEKKEEIINPSSEETNVEEEGRNTEKDLIQRRRALNELVETERDYFRDLSILMSGYRTAMIDKKLLPSDVIDQVFSNAELLHSVSKQIVISIKEQMDQLSKTHEGMNSIDYIEKLPLGKIFQTLAPLLKMYLQYCDNHDNALIVLSKYKKKKKEFEQFDNEQSAIYHGLFLKDYLIKPIQRLCKYPLLFQNILRVTPKDDPDFADLTTTLNKIDEIVRAINDIRDKNINFVALLQYEENLVDYPTTLLSRERKFIREGNVLLAEDKKSRVLNLKKGDGLERVMLVFNDRLLFCKKSYSIGKKDYSLVFKTEISTVDFIVGELYKDHPDCALAILIDVREESKKSKLLFFEDEKEKKRWFKVLHEVVNEAKRAVGGRDVEVLSFSEPLNAQTVSERTLRELVSQLVGPDGVSVKTRKYKLKTYKNCFVSKDLISWLCNKNVSANKIDALAISKRLVDLGYIQPAVKKETSIKDDIVPYRFSYTSTGPDARTPAKGTPDSIRKSRPNEESDSTRTSENPSLEGEHENTPTFTHAITSPPLISTPISSTPTSSTPISSTPPSPQIPLLSLNQLESVSQSASTQTSVASTNPEPQTQIPEQPIPTEQKTDN